MNRNIELLLIFIFSIISAIFLWDLIEIPINHEKLETKFYDFKNYINPLNDPIRFVIFLSIPFSSIIIYYQITQKKFLTNLKLVFFYDKNLEIEKFNKDNKQNKFFYLIVIILIFEFLILDFSHIVSSLDFMHEGMWLSASKNTQLSGSFWNSSYVIRGFFADFYPFFLWKIFNLESIGITRLFQLFVVLLNKIIIVKIVFNISKLTYFNNLKLILFFLLLSFFILLLQDYITPIFSLRSFLLLLFVLTFLNFLQNYNKNFYIFILGLFSSVSSFWFIDIGLYINFFLIVFILYILLRFEIKKLLILLSSIILSWSIFFVILPNSEFYEFFNNSFLIFTTLSWFHGIEFPKPFASLDARSSKAMLMFLISGFLIITSINSLKKQKILFISGMIFLFLISILYFNYGLNRSDSGHIRMATSFIFIPFTSLILMSLFEKFDSAFQKNIKIQKVLSLIVVAGILVSTIFFDKKYEKKNYTNLFSVKNSISELVYSNDKRYVDSEYFEFINHYKKITEKDNCMFIFTNEVALFYLMKKKSCSKHYHMWSSFPKNIQSKIINDIQTNKPNYLIYFSERDIFYNSQVSLKVVNEFILKNYSLYNKFKSWEIYKKR